MTGDMTARPRRHVRALIAFAALAVLVPALGSPAAAQEEPPPSVDLYFDIATFGSAVPGVPMRLDLVYMNGRD